ncbi:hypothetical protein [Krasilnikovia sp. MM14-A1259]|uniref:hypothetical protein n=1 Tax=Krasilnikovia sp. MM14-A1259 TaxID=3373539 RepID=UPI00382CDF5C
MTTDLLYRLLDVDPDSGPAELLHRARGTHYQLPYLVLSALARDGARMGEPARAELQRAQERSRRYADLAADLAAATGVRAIKGLQLAARYPADLLRPQGDLDLVAPDEAALWRAVTRIAEQHPVENIDVTVFGVEPRHTMVVMFWPAEDPLVDPWFKVEICTAALTGDFGCVPVRPVLHAPDHVECLIALAEEGLQRPFRHRDVLDVRALSTAEFDPADTVAAVAAYRLAPEAADLLDFAARYTPLGALAAVRAALEPEVTAEQCRRDRPPATIGAGRPEHGLFLRRVPVRPGWDSARVRSFGGGRLLLTPVADYLLTDREVVSRARYDAALAELDRDDRSRS